MSAIYTYGQWIDIVDRGTSGDQVMDILASWKVDAYKLLEDNHKLEAELARRDEIIKRMKEKLAREHQVSDALYLLLVDNPNTKLKAEQILIDIYGKCEPSLSDVSTTQDVLMDIKKDLSDAEIEELGAQEAEKRGEK